MKFTEEISKKRHKMNTPECIILICGTALGAATGSFANVCVFRWAQGGSVTNPPGSKCPKCESKIPIWRNIPLVSYTLQRGKCWHCQCKIPAKYLIWEIAGALLGLGITAYILH